MQNTNIYIYVNIPMQYNAINMLKYTITENAQICILKVCKNMLIIFINIKHMLKYA